MAHAEESTKLAGKEIYNLEEWSNQWKNIIWFFSPLGPISFMDLLWDCSQKWYSFCYKGHLFPRVSWSNGLINHTNSPWDSTVKLGPIELMTAQNIVRKIMCCFKSGDVGFATRDKLWTSQVQNCLVCKITDYLTSNSKNQWCYRHIACHYGSLSHTHTHA